MHACLRIGIFVRFCVIDEEKCCQYALRLGLRIVHEDITLQAAVGLQAMGADTVLVVCRRTVNLRAMYKG